MSFNSSSSSSRGTPNPLDKLVFDCMGLAVESILGERNALFRPVITGAAAATNPSSSRDVWMEYIRSVLAKWKTDDPLLSTPLVLDIYIHIPKHDENVLLERWNMSYGTSPDLKGDNKPFDLINRRVQTLVRSLYCFVRMLPGFNMLHLCGPTTKPTLSVHLFAEQRSSQPTFKHEVSRYQFAKISTSKGLISMGVTFLNSVPVKSMVKSIVSSASSGSASSAPQPIRRDPHSSASTSVPIPISPGSYEGNSGIGMARGRTTSSEARELQRRSFQHSLANDGIAHVHGPSQGRSYENGSFRGMEKDIGPSPLRPNDNSLLYTVSRSSPSGFPIPGTSPYVTNGSSNTQTQQMQNLIAKGSTTATPVGSYSNPFVFPNDLEPRYSDSIIKDLIPVGNSPQYSTSLTSTPPHVTGGLGQLYGHSMSEKRLSFRGSAATTSVGTTSNLTAALAAGSIHTNGDSGLNFGSTPLNSVQLECQAIRQLLQIPSFPIKTVLSLTQTERPQSAITSGLDSEKSKRRGSFGFKALLGTGDLQNRGDSAAPPTRSSSGGSSGGRDEFFEKLKDDGRASFFGDDEDELPFVVHQSELTGVLVAPRFAGLSSVAVPREIEAILSESRLQMNNFKQFAACSPFCPKLETHYANTNSNS